MQSFRMTLKWRLAKFLSLLFLIQAIGIPQMQPASAATACSSANIGVALKSNPVFYYKSRDSILANYIQVEITNNTAGTLTDYSVNIASITGGALRVAPYENSSHGIFGNLNVGAKRDLFWLLKPLANTLADQTITLDVKNASSSTVCQATIVIDKVSDSLIDANANKITTVSYSSISNTPSATGGYTFTVTIRGNAGTVGEGPEGVGDINLNPATDANFAAANFRLSQTTFVCQNAPGTTITNQIYIPSACGGQSGKDYEAVYTFQYLSSTVASGAVTKVSPVVNISSGTQMKYSSPDAGITIPSFTSSFTTQVTTQSASGKTTSSATINGSVDSGSITSGYFCKTSGSNPGANFTRPCSETITATSGSPYYTANLTGLNAGTYYYEFIGVSGGTEYSGGVKSFTIIAPTAGVYDTTTAASGITVESATLNGNSIGINSADIDTYYFLISTTDPGVNDLDPSVDDTVTATADISSSPYVYSGNASNLASGTKYYFELVVTSKTGAQYFGGVLNFTTLAVVTFNPNSGTLASGNLTDTSTATVGTNGLLNKPTSDPSRDGYRFSGWSLSPTGSVVTSHTLTGSQTYYAIWTEISRGGGGYTPPPPPPPPVYVPNPPTITSISSPEMCAAVGGQLIVNGTYLSGATAKVDGVSVRVTESSFGRMILSLPAAPVGTKSISVTNVDGTASTTVKFKFIDSPVYVNFLYPATYKDMEFSYTFTATNTEKYSITGVMPTGLTLNPLTGELSGTPTQTGNFLFTIVASNFCDQTYLDVYMFVDKAIPSTYTCTVQFNVPKSDNITDFKVSQLQTCLGKIKTLSPETIDPIIFISGGIPAGLSVFESLTHPRYMRIFEIIKGMGLDVQIYLGAFDGTPELVQLNVYWPMP